MYGSTIWDSLNHLKWGTDSAELSNSNYIQFTGMISFFFKWVFFGPAVLESFWMLCWKSTMRIGKSHKWEGFQSSFLSLVILGIQHPKTAPAYTSKDMAVVGIPCPVFSNLNIRRKAAGYNPFLEMLCLNAKSVCFHVFLGKLLNFNVPQPTTFTKTVVSKPYLCSCVFDLWILITSTATVLYTKS